MKRKFMLFCAYLLIGIGLAMAQDSGIEGIVVDAESNEPVIGASVLVKGTTDKGTVTDFEGKFTLNVEEGTELRISSVGMKTVEVKAKHKMTVRMESDTEVLQEVVVTGMQRIDKRLFTGASSQLSGADVKIDGLSDVSRSLEGRAAGVSVQNVSGTFGTAPKIRVRGATSIYGSSKPLWVIDGVIMEDAVDIDADALSSGDAETLISSSVAGLNADDIESFQILIYIWCTSYGGCDCCYNKER